GAPKPIAIEPCAGNRAAVLTVFLCLPRGPSGAPPPGQSGLAIASALIDISQQKPSDSKDKTSGVRNRKHHLSTRIPPFDEEIIVPCLTGYAAALSEQETEPLEDPSRYAVFYSSIQRCVLASTRKSGLYPGLERGENCGFKLFDFMRAPYEGEAWSDQKFEVFITLVTVISEGSGSGFTSSFFRVQGSQSQSITEDTEHSASRYLMTSDQTDPQSGQAITAESQDNP
ncbi:hypothetical protein MJG53_018566, partial [Ovis ammon polii x Ovis aries]